MFINPAMHVTVSGGSKEENLQLCSAIHQSLTMNGFTNCVLGSETDHANLPLLAQIRLINPDLFDNKIVVGVVPLNTPAPVNTGFLPGLFPNTGMGFVGDGNY